MHLDIVSRRPAGVRTSETCRHRHSARRAFEGKPMTELCESRCVVNDLLVETFNSILRIEENVLSNRLTKGLTIAEIHTIHAVGLHDSNPMNVVASRLGVTLATLTASVNKLVTKGYVERVRSESDRRQVLVSLTSAGRAAWRAHDLFHRQMVDAALAGLTSEEESVFVRGIIKIKTFFEDHEQDLVAQANSGG